MISRLRSYWRSHETGPRFEISSPLSVYGIRERLAGKAPSLDKADGFARQLNLRGFFDESSIFIELRDVYLSGVLTPGNSGTSITIRQLSPAIVPVQVLLMLYMLMIPVSALFNLFAGRPQGIEILIAAAIVPGSLGVIQRLRRRMLVAMDPEDVVQTIGKLVLAHEIRRSSPPI